MLLTTKDGIACDMCGGISKNNFTYYSFESKGVKVDIGAQVINQLGSDLDIDVCEKCYNTCIDKVKKNLASAVVKNTVKCDFCTKILKGAFTYHILVIHQVLVDKSRTDKSTDVSKNFMDFNVDDDCFRDLANAALETRAKVKKQGEWS